MPEITYCNAGFTLKKLDLAVIKHAWTFQLISQLQIDYPVCLLGVNYVYFDKIFL